MSTASDTAPASTSKFGGTQPNGKEEAVACNYSHTFPLILHRLGISALISTYQAGQLIVARADTEATLAPLFRPMPRPMGIAVGRDLAIGTLQQVQEYRHHPAAGKRLDASGRHDLVFVPCTSKITGDIRIHEMVYLGNELWCANTRFSCLATLDRDHSFVPRWRPPFISALAAEDRCHLNGIAVKDGKITHVSALGATDSNHGWRENKASGGILMEVPSGRIITSGLSMPHSPRWFDGKLWVLESGKGTLAHLDERGQVVTVAEFPGFTRGLAMVGRYAFVGLSKVRETNAFGGIQLNERVREKQCGVAVFDLISRKTVAMLGFEGAIAEIFDIQLIRSRWPDVLGPESDLTATSYIVPDTAVSPSAI